MAETTIPDQTLIALLEAVDKANAAAAARSAAGLTRRQPVHTVYGGAQLFKAGTPQKLGALARAALAEYAPDPPALADVFEVAPDVAARIYPRVVEKLAREPIEDLRIDFEDGFGPRSDEDEDRFARAAADEVARAHAEGALPPGLGIRIKPLGEETKRRSLRTFDLFLTRLLDRTGGGLPANFVVTLPKITAPGQVAALASACDAFEYWRELDAGALKCEVMIETPQSIVAGDGALALPRLVAEGGGRIVAAHFGPYDYTASLGITATHQTLGHPACELARSLMQLSLAGTGVVVVDGPTNIMPIGPYRRDPAAPPLAASARDENQRTVRRAWQLHAGNVRRALIAGIYQGWDLHPAQLPSRYAVVYAFFQDGLDAASERLRHLVDQAAQATMVGQVFDDAATGQGLLNYFLRALNCGAMSEDEAVERSGLTLEELRERSFLKIAARRSG